MEAVAMMMVMVMLLSTTTQLFMVKMIWILRIIQKRESQTTMRHHHSAHLCHSRALLALAPVHLRYKDHRPFLRPFDTQHINHIIKPVESVKV
jgi:hypothetical protein